MLDIKASAENREPNYELIKNVVSEAFMPVGYGGGIKNIDQIEKLFSLGIEKVAINSYFDSSLVLKASKVFGSQSLVGCIDVKKNMFGNYEIYRLNGKSKINQDLLEQLQILQDSGVGEIFINNINRDGTMKGFDLSLIDLVVNKTHVPCVFVGGAGNIDHLREAFEHGAHGVAAGSIFVYHGPHKAVLIKYISNYELEKGWSIKK